MERGFAPGDDFIFQVESGYGLLRLLAVTGEGTEAVWHLLAYEEFFPDVESAERSLAQRDLLRVRVSHMALTNRAFERTPVARLANCALQENELMAYNEWLQTEPRVVSDRSALLMLGIR